MGIFSKSSQISLFCAPKRAILPYITGIKIEKNANFKTKKTLTANTISLTHLINIYGSHRLFPASKNEIATKSLFLPKK